MNKAFDVKSLRQDCAKRAIVTNIPRNRRATDWQTDDDTLLDPKLYRHQFVIEQMNAWLDSFKTLLVRYEICLENWLAFHWRAFVVLLLRKIAHSPPS
jgi:hypothetical protein